MKNKIGTVIVAVVLIAGGVYLATRKGGEVKPETQALLEQVKQSDVQRMASDDDVAEKAKSLRRMAFQNPEKAMEFTRQFVNDPSPVLRAAAYETAGSFQGEEWDKLAAEGLNDTEPEVRVATLKGLNRQPGEARSQLIAAYFAKGDKTPREQIWAQMAVMRGAVDDRGRKAKESEVLALLKKVDRPTQGEVLIELYKFWPGRPELIAFAENIVRSAQETPDFMPSFRYLSAYAQENLGTVLKASSWPDSRAFLLDVVGFVMEKCPRDSDAIVAKITKHSRVDAEVEGKVKELISGGKCRAE